MTNGSSEIVRKIFQDRIVLRSKGVAGKYLALIVVMLIQLMTVAMLVIGKKQYTFSVLLNHG